MDTIYLIHLKFISSSGGYSLQQSTIALLSNLFKQPFQPVCTIKTNWTTIHSIRVKSELSEKPVTSFTIPCFDLNSIAYPPINSSICSQFLFYFIFYFHLLSYETASCCSPLFDSFLFRFWSPTNFIF